MLHAIALSLALRTPPVHEANGETEVTAAYTAIDLFKNGEAVLTRELRVPGDGVYVLYDDLVHRHGTLRIDAPGSIRLQRTTRMRQAPAGPTDPTVEFDLQAAMIGRRAVIRLTDALQPIEGVLRSVPNSITGQWITQPRQPSRYAPDPSVASPSAPASTFRGTDYIVIETTTGLQVVSPARMASIEVLGTVLDEHPISMEPRRVEEPTVLLTATGFGQAPAVVRMTYLTSGITWAPSYSVKLLNDTELELVQNATIRNELVDLEGTVVRLVTGTPVMKCRSVNSPFSAATSLGPFFDQLIEAEREDYWFWRVRPETGFMSQSASLRSTPDSGRISAALFSATDDLQYRSIGELDLQLNDSLFLELARARTPYEELVEVRVAPPNNESGRRSGDRSAEGEPRAKAWNVIRYQNPFDVATSTGPVTIADEGNFNSQVELPWTAAGAVADLRTSRALTIEAVADEWEDTNDRVPRQRDQLYASTKYVGSLLLTNRRAAPARIRALVEFYGLVQAPAAESEVQPISQHVSSGWSINPHTELTWELELEPGESITLSYEYEFKTR